MANRKFTVVNRRSKSYSRQDHNSEPLFERNYEKEYNEDSDKAAQQLKVVDKFIAKLCRSYVDKMVETERHNRKYCILYKYNDNPERGEIYNDSIEGLDTKYILSGKWIPLARQFYAPHKCRSIEHRLNDYINDKKFNDGVDPITKNKYKISVFYYKSQNSAFPNGIIISRDGIKYS